MKQGIAALLTPPVVPESRGFYWVIGHSTEHRGTKSLALRRKMKNKQRRYTPK